jgi:hypothetical protein
MGFISDTAKKIAFWNYSRTSWQWDVLCVLILAFIFLTPKSWFSSHQDVLTATILSVDLVDKQGDNAESEVVRRAREMLKRPNGQVVYPLRRRTDSSGKVVAYEVDIR